MKQIIKDFLVNTIPIFLLTLLVGIVKVISIKQEGSIYNKILNFFSGCILGSIAGYTAKAQGLSTVWVIVLTAVFTLLSEQIITYIDKNGLKSVVKYVNKKADTEIEEPTPPQTNPPPDGK